MWDYHQLIIKSDSDSDGSSNTSIIERENFQSKGNIKGRVLEGKDWRQKGTLPCGGRFLETRLVERAVLGKSGIWYAYAIGYCAAGGGATEDKDVGEGGESCAVERREGRRAHSCRFECRGARGFEGQRMRWVSIQSGRGDDDVRLASDKDVLLDWSCLGLAGKGGSAFYPAKSLDFTVIDDNGYDTVWYGMAGCKCVQQSSKREQSRAEQRSGDIVSFLSQRYGWLESPKFILVDQGSHWSIPVARTAKPSPSYGYDYDHDYNYHLLLPTTAYCYRYKLLILLLLLSSLGWPGCSRPGTYDGKDQGSFVSNWAWASLYF